MFCVPAVLFERNIHNQINQTRIDRRVSQFERNIETMRNLTREFISHLRLSLSKYFPKKEIKIRVMENPKTPFIILPISAVQSNAAREHFVNHKEMDLETRISVCKKRGFRFPKNAYLPPKAKAK